MPINSIWLDSSSLTDVTMNDSVMSIDDKLIGAYAEMSHAFSAEQEDVLKHTQDRTVISDPEELFILQKRTSEYNLNVSLISALTRKGVSTVETLLRS